MTPILAICAALTIALTAYSLGHYLCVLVSLPRRLKPREFDDHPEKQVAILVPARNEGEGAVRAIQSLMDQDHGGAIEVFLLLKDRGDTSIRFLEAAFPEAQLAVDGGEIVELVHTEGRTARVAFTGDDGKRDKVNWITRRLNTHYVAILDCDHQAHSDWIRSSLCLLHERGARMIQGRRSPLTARGFFPLWDSLHQHVGCELFNTAFTRLDLTVFFTGTTVVLETELLKARPLRDCITEDVDFSYAQLMDGHKIIHNPYSGSDEEVSPDLYSFLARRRRWSNGHTNAFFHHLGKLWRAPLSLKDKAQFLFHGAHYLVCCLVFVLHGIIGLIFVRELSPVAAGAAALASVVLAVWLSRTQRAATWGTRASEVAVVWGWFFPAVVIVMNLAMAFLAGDPSRAALPLPYALQAIGLVGLVAPLVVLLAGLAVFRQLGVGTFLGVVLTYPLAFYLDISGVLIGLTDFLCGRQTWLAVARAAQPATAETPVRPAGLSPTEGIRESWQLGAVLVATPGTLKKAAVRLSKPSCWFPIALLAGLVIGGVLYVPSNRLQVADVGCEALEHDGEPWIVPAEQLVGYCDPAGSAKRSRWTKRSGSYEQQRHDELATVDPNFWDRMESTFPCNHSAFSPDNVLPMEGGGVKLHLEARESGGKDYSSGSIATKEADDAQHLYGRFETVMKPARGSGLITAFFLYRFDPWQEIDAEFLGQDTTRILLNVYYNPGEDGDLYNYGYRGTPVLVDLGFDAADDFHHYAIEWDPGEIRWFVDDQLIHRRPSGRPTPVPHLPMRFHINTWPICSEELAGPFDAEVLPVDAEIRSVIFSSWQPSPWEGVHTFMDGVFPSREATDWREDASWIQP